MKEWCTFLGVSGPNDIAPVIYFLSCFLIQDCFCPYLKKTWMLRKEVANNKTPPKAAKTHFKGLHKIL